MSRIVFKCGPRPVASASLGNLEMHILRHHPRPTGPEFIDAGPSVWILTSSPGDSEDHLKNLAETK